MGLSAATLPIDDAQTSRFERVWHPSWRYSDAMAFLDDRSRAVASGAPMVLATGVHHPAVITLGRHTETTQILDERRIHELGATVVRTERGGGATAHMAGQVVLYPVVSLDTLGLSLPDFTTRLGEAVRRTLARWNIASTLDDDGVGVFVGGRKIASIGLRARRRVITHGVAVNVDNDLRFFDAIAPCGMPGRPMTSMRIACADAPCPSVGEIQDRLACELASLLVLR